MEGLAQKSLSAGPRALRDSTALMLAEAARMNGPRSARHSKGVTWMEETLAASRRIAWLSLAPGRSLFRHRLLPARSKRLLRRGLA